MVSENEFEARKRELETKYKQAWEQLDKSILAINYYENTALNNADTILKTAGLQLQNGEINYLEWVMLVNQATSIQSQYIDAIKNLNSHIIEIESFINH